MTLLEKIIADNHNQEDYKEIVASHITHDLGKKGNISKEQVHELIKDAIEWGIQWADSYPNRLN